MCTFGKILMREGILWGTFYAGGLDVERFLHTPVTSLAKYSPGVIMDSNITMK